MKRCFEVTPIFCVISCFVREQCNETISYGDIALYADNFVSRLFSDPSVL